MKITAEEARRALEWCCADLPTDTAREQIVAAYIYQCEAEIAVMQNSVIEAMVRLPNVSAYIKQVEAERDNAVRELADLKAKLPKTADGKTVIPFDEVFHPDWTSPGAITVIRHGEQVNTCLTSCNRPELPDEVEWVGEASYSEADVNYWDYFAKPASECYSTRQAAEEAKGKP
jgi:hypothetical protein